MGSAARTFPGIASAPTRASRPLPVPALQSPIKIAGWHDHPPLPFTLEGASSSEAGAARGGGAACRRPTTARPAWAVDDGGGRARRGGLAACAAAAPCAGRGPATTLLVRRRAVVGMAVACVVAAEKEDESEKKAAASHLLFPILTSAFVGGCSLTCALSLPHTPHTQRTTPTTHPHAQLCCSQARCRSAGRPSVAAAAARRRAAPRPPRPGRPCCARPWRPRWRAGGRPLPPAAGGGA